MGRSPCCEKIGLKKGPWTPEEDRKLLAYIEEHGHGSWRALPAKAGLQRCGKSCRLRWTNYLRPDIKRGKFSLQEEQTIIQLHALLGNRWSAIATHLAKRTDNEIKNYWNTHLKKRLCKMGIDPMTHKPKNTTLLSSDGQFKHAANLSHMAQWESARLEAEARLARQSELRSASFHNYTLGSSELSSTSSSPLNKPKEWLWNSKSWNNGAWDRRGADLSGGVCKVSDVGIGVDLESPTSTISYSERVCKEIVANSSIMEEEEEEDGKEICKEFENSNSLLSYTSGLRKLTVPVDRSWALPEQIQPDSDHYDSNGNFVHIFTDLLDSNPRDQGTSFTELGSDKVHGNGTEYFEDKNNYWNSILNAVNSSPADSPVFEWELPS